MTRHRLRNDLPDPSQQVRFKGSRTGRAGVIVLRGPQVSEVRWSDGTTQYCPNHWLEPVRVKLRVERVKLLKKH